MQDLKRQVDDLQCQIDALSRKQNALKRLIELYGEIRTIKNQLEEPELLGLKIYDIKGELCVKFYELCDLCEFSYGSGRFRPITHQGLKYVPIRVLMFLDRSHRPKARELAQAARDFLGEI